MDIVPWVASAQTFLASHPALDAAGGAFLGMLASHPLQCADAVCKVVEKIPGAKPLLRKNWPAIKDFLDKFEERFGTDLATDDAPAPEKKAAPEGEPAP